MLAVHEEKIAQNVADTGDLFDLVEKRRKEQDEAAKELHSRITTQQREIKEELRDDYQRLTDNISEIKAMLKTAMNENAREMHDMDDRMRQIERKQWIIVGAAIVGGFILGNLEIFKSFIG
jgi:chromatin segregation and condensation protein Rec8/ScpA/Scc1 (kleisin family)